MRGCWWIWPATRVSRYWSRQEARKPSTSPGGRVWRHHTHNRRPRPPRGQPTRPEKHRRLVWPRGASSFATKPTPPKGAPAALAKIKKSAKPRRKRLLIVEDNVAEQMS